MIKKILIFPSGTEIASEILNSIKFSKEFIVYGANSVEDHSSFIFKNNFNNLPHIFDENFLEKLNNLIMKLNIDLLIPAHDDAVFYFSQIKDKIKCDVLVSDFKTCDICRSKEKTYNFFQEFDFIPNVLTQISNINSFPLFLKPKIGQGSKGAFKIENERELNFRISSENILTEYLPGKEYTIECFTDNKRELRLISQRIRERTKNGISTKSKFVKLNKKVKLIAEIINSNLSFKGAWFFQVKEDVNNNLKLMEISPRIPGTSCLSRNLDKNLVLLSIYDFFNFEINFTNNSLKLLEVDRALINRFKFNFNYKYIYLDFDDCLLLKKNLVNQFLILLLYQELNKKKKIILITKHKKNILLSLKKLKISSDIFYEIHTLKKDEEKHTYIKHLNSIFIDDSFKERYNVSKYKKIPVFDINSVECLIDWRV